MGNEFMNTVIKKTASALLGLTLLIPAVPTFAASDVANYENANQAISQTRISIPAEVVGLDRYIVRQDDGTLYLNAETVVKAGYNENAIKGIISHLKDINEGVLEGRYTTDKNLNINTVGTSSNSITASGGVTKMVNHWYGWELYLNANDTARLQNDLSNASWLAGIPGIDAALPYVSFGLSTYERAINAAAQGGRGIIIVQNNNWQNPDLPIFAVLAQ